MTLRSEEPYRDRSQYGRIIVTLDPAGFIGSASKSVRREETPSMRAAYETPVQTRVIRERAQRSGAKPSFAKRSRL